MNWLNRLKSLAQRMCVAPANYAQADLDALQRVGDPGLSSIATNGAGDIVDQILGITSTRGATLVGDGPLTGPAIQLLSAQGPTVAVAAANLDRSGLRRTANRRPQTSPRCATRRKWSPHRSTPPSRAALAGRRAPIRGPRRISMRRWTFRSQHDSAVARRQDALGSLLWRALAPDAEPRSQILMPPMEWGAAGRRRRGDPVRGRHLDPGRVWPRRGR